MSKRIPSAFIHQLLDRIELVDLIGQKIRLKKTGINYSACCPFHQEKTPSFSVNPQKQFFYCFGCGKHGNAITFLMDYEHLEFVECVEELARSVGWEVPYEISHYDQNNSSTLNTNPADQEQLYAVMEAASVFFQQQLRHHPDASEAVQYLKSRGLTGQIAKQFSIGYAPPGWDLLLKNFDPSHQSTLLTAGLIIQNDQGRVYDRFRHRVMFPIKDRRGRVVGFGGRVLNNEDKPKYLNSPETPIFHKGEILYGLYEAKKALTHFEQTLLVEGYMDVVALHEHGLPFAMAALGTATSEIHLKTLLKLSKKLIICFDGDHAGRQAALRALNLALPLLTGQEEIKFLFLPEEEDPDSLVRKEGKEVFLQRFQTATSLSNYLLQVIQADLNLNTVEGRSQLVSKALPYLAKLPDSYYQELLIQQIADLSHLAAVKIKRQLETLLKPTSQPPASLKESTHTHSPIRAKTPMEKTLGFMIQYPQQFPAATQLSIPDHLIQDQPAKQLFNQLLLLLQTYPNLTTGQIFEHFREGALAPEIARFSQVEFDLDPASLQQEVLDILKKQAQESEQQAISTLIEKSKLHELTPEEKQQLRDLLSPKKQV